MIRALHSRNRAATSRLVFIVGAQRSGTTLLLRCLEDVPDIRAVNETNRRLFRNYFLRDEARLAEFVRTSKRPIVVLKALCDSHRICELVDRFSDTFPTTVVWMVRDPRDRVRSAVTRFGEADAALMAGVVASPDDAWCSRGLADADREVVKGHLAHARSAEAGAALFWWARNKSIFESGIGRRRDTVIVDYDELIADPGATLRRLCGQIGCEPSLRSVGRVRARSSRSRSAWSGGVSSELQGLCDSLYDQIRLASGLESDSPRRAGEDG